MDQLLTMGMAIMGVALIITNLVLDERQSIRLARMVAQTRQFKATFTLDEATIEYLHEALRDVQHQRLLRDAEALRTERHEAAVTHNQVNGTPIRTGDRGAV